MHIFFQFLFLLSCQGSSKLNLRQQKCCPPSPWQFLSFTPTDKHPGIGTLSVKPHPTLHPYKPENCFRRFLCELKFAIVHIFVNIRGRSSLKARPTGLKMLKVSAMKIRHPDKMSNTLKAESNGMMFAAFSGECQPSGGSQNPTADKPSLIIFTTAKSLPCFRHWCHSSWRSAGLLHHHKLERLCSCLRHIKFHFFFVEAKD